MEQFLSVVFKGSLLPEQIYNTPQLPGGCESHSSRVDARVHPQRRIPSSASNGSHNSATQRALARVGFSLCLFLTTFSDDFGKIRVRQGDFIVKSPDFECRVLGSNPGSDSP